ncbi:NAD(P)H-binding protein [Nonomuraea longicatena]|uniref:NAD(P)H-binding protein n=1 Tax=Nonomuraea longicatena TaxID=83682 RepID=A0ABN1QA71_9ACTN
MIVVTGATGNVGRALVRALADKGEDVTATSRGITGEDVPQGVRHRRADLGDPAGLAPVLDGADALFLQSGGPDAGRLRPRDILDAAKAGGVERVVLLSSQGVETRPRSHSHGVLMRSIEDVVRESGLDWTVLRPSGFASNTFGWAESVRTTRTVRAPFADTGLPVIDPQDIAEVAAAVLRENGHAGRVYTLTGPAPITPRQQAAAIAAALGEEVRFAEQSGDDARAALLRFLPEPVVETTLAILGTPTEAERRPGQDVERILGRPAGAYGEWARRNVAAFR